MPRLSLPQKGHVPLAVKARMMCGLLGFVWSSRGPRRRFASASASGVGSVHGPFTGLPSSVGYRLEGGAFEVRRART